MIDVSVVAKGSARHLFSDRPLVAIIVFLTTNYGFDIIYLATNCESLYYTFNNQGYPYSVSRRTLVQTFSQQV
jgi:hypothetical protein